MNLKSLYRILTLFVGVCTVAVILLSKFVPASADVVKEKEGSGKTEVIIHAPADVASQSTSVDVPQHQPGLITTLKLDEKREGIFAEVKKTFASLFKTLFRAVISPNAP